MNRKSFLILLFSFLTGSMTVQAQIRNTDDPDISLDMDIEAKAKAAILKLSTFSRVSQITPDAYIVITFMNDSVQKLTGRVRNDNKMYEPDAGHGFADRFVSHAVFNLKPEQAELFKYGIKSLQIRMVPKPYYHEWEEDELGLLLYSRYLFSKQNVMFPKK